METMKQADALLDVWSDEEDLLQEVKQEPGQEFEKEPGQEHTPEEEIHELCPSDVY